MYTVHTHIYYANKDLFCMRLIVLTAQFILFYNFLLQNKSMIIYNFYVWSTSPCSTSTCLFILWWISVCQWMFSALVNAELDTEPDIKLTAQVRHFMRHYSFQCSASCSVWQDGGIKTEKERARKKKILTLTDPIAPIRWTELIIQ